MKKPKPETRAEATLRMLHDENSWPNWPVLPMKRSTKSTSGLPEVGLLYAGRNEIVLENLWDLSNPNRPTAKVLSYPNLDAIIADGWEVD